MPDNQLVWSDVENLLHKWLKERQELIMLFCAINGLSDFTPKQTPISVKVEAFCEILVDYVSAGHFEVYQKLILEGQLFKDGPSLELASTLSHPLQLTTQYILEFNDLYTNQAEFDLHADELTKRLSKLGEVLEERFELEDQLIEALHHSHKGQVA